MVALPLPPAAPTPSGGGGGCATYLKPAPANPGKVNGRILSFPQICLFKNGPSSFLVAGAAAAHSAGVSGGGGGSGGDGSSATHFEPVPVWPENVNSRITLFSKLRLK